MVNRMFFWQTYATVFLYIFIFELSIFWEEIFTF